MQPYLRQAITKIEVLVVLAVLAVGLLVVRPGGRGKNVAGDRAKCLANLEIIGRALSSYLIDSGNHWPCVSKLATAKLESSPWPTLPETLGKYMDHRSDAFHCPADRRILSGDSPLRKKFSEKTTYFDTEGTSYEWWFGEVYGGKKVGEESLAKAGGFGMGRADQPLLSDFEPFHSGDDQGAINTLNADLKPRTTRARPKM